MKIKKCFIIFPMSQEGSELNKYYNSFWKHIIIPVCNEHGYTPLKIDEIYNTHLITRETLQSIIEADLIIADLSYSNPIVMYQLGVIHSTGKPVISLIKQGEIVPFDIYTVGVITYDLYDLDKIDHTRNALSTAINTLERTNQNTSPIVDANLMNKLQSEKISNVIHNDFLIWNFSHLSKHWLIK